MIGCISRISKLQSQRPWLGNSFYTLSLEWREYPENLCIANFLVCGGRDRIATKTIIGGLFGMRCSEKMERIAVLAVSLPAGRSTVHTF